MPTILRFAGLRTAIYPNDHRPAHGHVIGNDCEAVFDLECPQGPAVLRENYGFGRLVLARIRQKVKVHQSKLCREWEKVHGNS